MTNDRHRWGEDKTGGYAEENSLAEDELVELGAKAGEHHSNHE